MDKHLGRLEVTAEMLAHALKFPHEHRIIGIYKEWRINRETYHLIVEGPQMPKCAEGEEIPRVEGTYFGDKGLEFKNG